MLTGDDEGIFGIDAQFLYAIKPLDREKQPSYSLQVTHYIVQCFSFPWTANSTSVNLRLEIYQNTFFTHPYWIAFILFLVLDKDLKSLLRLWVTVSHAETKHMEFRVMVSVLQVSFKPLGIVHNIKSSAHRQTFTVEVCVIDKNDNVPTFIEQSMRGSVQLGLLKGTGTLRSSTNIHFH